MKKILILVFLIVLVGCSTIKIKEDGIKFENVEEYTPSGSEGYICNVCADSDALGYNPITKEYDYEPGQIKEGFENCWQVVKSYNGCASYGNE